MNIIGLFLAHAMNRLRFALTKSVILSLGIATLLGCTGKEPSSDPDAKKPDGAVLTFHEPEKRTLTRIIEVTGEVKAFEEAPMHARISGYVGAVRKDIGDRVEAGDVLAEITVPERVEETKQKRAIVTQCRSEVERAEKLWSAADANVKAAGAKVKEAAAAVQRFDAELRRAESQHERFKKNPGVVSEEVLAEAKLGVEAARAAVAEAEAKVKSAEAARAESEARRHSALTDIDVARARVGVAEADAGHSEELLKYAKLRAPFSGIILRRDVDPGHFVHAVTGEKTKPLFVVAKLDPVRVFLDVPENDAPFISKGTTAVVHIQALNGGDIRGAITRTSWGLDSESRTLRAEVDLPNAEEKLRVGMYATASLILTRSDVWTIPARAVISKGGQSFCFLYKDGKAWRRQVLTGFQDDDRVEIRQIQAADSKSGWVRVESADRFLSGDLSKLVDGASATAAPAP